MSSATPSVSLEASDAGQPELQRVTIGPPAWIVGSVLVVAVLGAALVLWLMLFGGGDPADEPLLVENADGSVSLLDPVTGESRFDVDNAVPTHDRSALLTTRISETRTVLESRDPSTGSVTGSTTLDGSLTVRTVSPDGGAVALMPGEKGDGIYDPTPRASTELSVAFLDERPALAFELDGNLEPEMFSLDESALFMLDFVPADDPTSYFVKKLDLASGELSETDSIQVDLEPKMNGRARAQVLHPEGRYLYTLYTLPADAPVHDVDASGSSERWSFVHVISLEEEWSFCIFLPEPIGTKDLPTIGMTISSDGERLLVADPAVSTIAEIDTEELTVTALHPVERLQDIGERAVLATADDGTTYVAAGHIVLELAPGTFAATYAWAQEATVTGLAVAGNQLRVAGGGEVVLVDRISHEETGVLSAGDRGTVGLLGPPRGSVLEFPLECAC